MPRFAAVWTKRLLDIGLTSVGLLLLLPLLVVIAVVTRIKLGSPVLFRQPRIGQHGHIFTIYKFRTMTDERDEDGALLPDDQRITPLGALLRSMSLDELLELFNVVRGDMSLVGPRPLLVQ